MRNNNKLIKQVIYKMKQRFGSAITLLERVTITYDNETGVQTETQTTHDIKRAVVLPVKVVPDFSYDLSFIAANKNFTMGGIYTQNTRIVIVDKKDLSGSVINLDWVCTYKSNTYNIKAIDITNDDLSYVLTLIKIGDN